MSYSNYLSDSGFCGDRSLYSDGYGYGMDMQYYGIYNRIANEYQPQFSCPQNNDLYTTSSSTKGNKALDYPIGLITADEVAYAGGVFNKSNNSYYLYTGVKYYTISPIQFDGFDANVHGVKIDGSLGWTFVSSINYSEVSSVRPVINLKSNVEITSGDGTISNPYVIKTN